MGIYIPWLVDAARMASAGTGHQVIVAPGWQTRGHGGMRVVELVVGHHTGTPDTAPGDYPSLRIVRDGRADLAGPLSNYGLGRNGDIFVIAAGLCYHAGASAFGGYTDLNDEAIGIEAESAGGGRWTDAQLVMYPRLVGACLHYMRRGVDRYASHRTVARPAGRKPDPTGIADDWMRRQAAAFLAAPTAQLHKEKKNVNHLTLGKVTGTPAIWVGDGITRRQIKDEGELAGLQFWITKRGGDATVYDIDDLRVLGAPLPDAGRA
jgi:N-acetylmuramoyl-L-alanine amidase